MKNMKALPIINAHIEIGEDAFAHVRIWAVPQPVRGSAHAYKYALAYIVAGECVLRYDGGQGRSQALGRGRIRL